MLLEIVEDWKADLSLETSNEKVQEAETRYERAKELYL